MGIDCSLAHLHGNLRRIMQCPSNEVLEYLQKKYEQQIAQLQAAGKPVPEDLVRVVCCWFRLFQLFLTKALLLWMLTSLP